MADEYIKRSDAIDYIEDFVLMNKYYHPYSKRTTIPIAEAIARINETPSADVAKVVRCKDCKNNYVTTHNHGKQDDPRCDFTDRHLSLDDFCSRGERRMDGET